MIILLYGEDVFRSRLQLDFYKKAFLKKYGLHSSCLAFSAENDFNLQEAVFSDSLFTPAKMIIIRNALKDLSVSQQKEIENFFSSHSYLIPDKKNILIFWEEGPVEESNAFVKFLKNKARCEYFERLTGNKLTNWIKKRLRTINPSVEISSRTAAFLAESVLGDTEQINNELIKLANYVDQGNISEKEIYLLTQAKASSRIFSTIEAATSTNKKRAVWLFHQELKSGKDPFYVLHMYFSHLRNLLKVYDCIRLGKKNLKQISASVNLHPYVVQKSLSQLKVLSFHKLKGIYCRLIETDIKIKTGQIDPVLAIDKFLFEI